jgi:hypothetical protein
MDQNAYSVLVGLDWGLGFHSSNNDALASLELIMYHETHFDFQRKVLENSRYTEYRF